MRPGNLATRIYAGDITHLMHSGEEVRRIEGAVLTQVKGSFTYDGQDVVYEVETKPKPFVGTTSSISTYQNGPGIDNKLSLFKDGEYKYFAQDHLGSTDALTDSTGGVTEEETYDAFGTPGHVAFVPACGGYAAIKP
ncbi:MAG: hypothetical protein ABL984_09535 [Pyrinomonadaceae bacterium]